jgi:cyclic dehypoxanthinyl futalosine synthase
MKTHGSFRAVSVGFLNSVVYRVLRELPWIQFSECPPAECARRLHEGECELALLPVAEGLLSGEYDFFDYGIVTHERAATVTLVSRVPWEQVSRILLDSSSRTSVILLRTLFQMGALVQKPEKISFTRAAPESIAGRVSGSTAGLVIGDIAMAVQSSFPFVADLGRIWFEQTGKPFVFAVWALREDRLTNLQRSTISGAFERSLGGMERSIAGWSKEFGMDEERVREYLTSTIYYRIDGHALSGLREFHRRASAFGFLPAGELFVEPVLESLPWSASAPRRARISLPRRDWTALLDDRLSGKRLSVQDLLTLADKAATPDLLAGAFAAGKTYAAKRQSAVEVLLTNMCALRFPVSPLFRAPGQAGGYVLSAHEVLERCKTAPAPQGGEIWLRGGINPECGLPYYESVFGQLQKLPESRVAALSPQEIHWLAGETRFAAADLLHRLKETGLSILGDGGFAPLLDKFAIRLPGLLSSRDWFAIRFQAHEAGIGARCVHALGLGESQRDRILHLAKIRRLQDEVGTVESVRCLIFPGHEKERKHRMSDFLRELALVRLFLDNVARVETTDLRGRTPYSGLSVLIAQNAFNPAISGANERA